MDGAKEIMFGGQRLALLPDRAVWWATRQTLIVADVHLGKGTAFRRAGLPVPSGGSAKDLSRLSALLEYTGARRLVVLGDLVHAKGSHQEELAEEAIRWRESRRTVEMLLVRGNHDRSAGRVPVAWGIEEVEEPFEEGGLVYAHEPRDEAGAAVLAGHVHPVLGVKDFARSVVRLACFVVDGDRCLTLPAFGSFTGGHAIQRQEGRRVYVTSGIRVVSA